jgi:hypothetical protein
MPPTVMTPWFTPCCGLWVVLVGGAAVLPPELVFVPELVLPLEALWLRGAACWLTTGVPADGLPLLGGVAAPDVAPLLLGVPVLEPLLRGAV